MEEAGDLGVVAASGAATALLLEVPAHADGRGVVHLVLSLLISILLSVLLLLLNIQGSP